MMRENPSDNPDFSGKNNSESNANCDICSGKIIDDAVRGERYCIQCGCVSSTDGFDYDHPSDHSYGGSSGSNPGRSELSIGGAKMGNSDAWGSPIPRSRLAKYNRLDKIQKNLDRRKKYAESNRVVERAMEIARSKMAYPNENLIERSRRLLMDILNDGQDGTSLFITGSRWNAEAAAMACLSLDSGKGHLYRMIGEHADQMGIVGKKDLRGLRRRSLGVWSMLMMRGRTTDGYKAMGGTVCFVVPHDLEESMSITFSEQIGDWLERRRGSFTVAGIKFPNVDDIDNAISSILGDPDSIGLSGGEHLEPVLDSILLVLADGVNRNLGMSGVSEAGGISKSARKYTRGVRGALRPSL